MKIRKRDLAPLANKFFWTILLLPLIIILALTRCTDSDPLTSAEYIKEIEHWQQLRVDSLKGQTGYLNLAGLFWLSDEVSSIGTDSSSTFIFPDKAAARLGKMVMRNDSIWFIQYEKGLVKLAGNIATDTSLVFYGDSIHVSMSYGALHWFIIKRGTEYGIRVKDYNHPILASFNNIDNYPIEAKWKVEATWEQYPEPKDIVVKNQVGMDLDQQVFGALHFELEGKPYKLEPLGSVDVDEYFVLIYDETSGHATYGSGRYIYVPHVNEMGVTYIDFNKAFNPPCAYTDFATCIFPHKDNRLLLRIEAGEKYSGSH